ncbi:hypothetical protein GQ457_04G028400 [Hibiscus cannabinus]
MVQLYSKLSATHVMHLYCRLRAMKKRSMSIGEYTTQIKEVCDLLASCGRSISKIEQIAIILNGLTLKYC